MHHSIPITNARDGKNMPYFCEETATDPSQHIIESIRGCWKWNKEIAAHRHRGTAFCPLAIEMAIA